MWIIYLLLVLFGLAPFSWYAVGFIFLVDCILEMHNNPRAN